VHSNYLTNITYNYSIYYYFYFIAGTKAEKAVLYSGILSIDEATCMTRVHYIMLHILPSLPVTISGGGDSGSCLGEDVGGRMGVASTDSRG